MSLTKQINKQTQAWVEHMEVFSPRGELPRIVLHIYWGEVDENGEWLTGEDGKPLPLERTNGEQVTVQLTPEDLGYEITSGTTVGGAVADLTELVDDALNRLLPSQQPAAES